MKVVSVINQKGGVGKTTTAEAIASGLKLKGYRVLSIDLDAQGNFSHTAGLQQSEGSSLEMLLGRETALASIQHTEFSDILPSSEDLVGADAILTKVGKEYRLSEALEPIKNSYEYVVIDTPPELGILTVNALTASQHVVIPAQADLYSLMGIRQLNETIETVRKYCNSNLKVDGIVLTRYNPRVVLNRESATQASAIAAEMGTRIFNATIREGVAVREAQACQKSIFTYAPKANVTMDYDDFLAELIDRWKEGPNG